MNFEVIATVVGIAIVIFSLWVSMHVVAAKHLERTQKFLQLCLVWFVPVFGPIVVESMLRSEGQPAYIPEKGYTEPNDSGVSE
jgi:hypothetical protein